LTRRLLALRNGSDILRLGDLRVVHADDRILVFERHLGEQALLCCFNLSPEPVSWSAAQGRVIERVGPVEDDRLGPYSGYIAGNDA